MATGFKDPARLKSFKFKIPFVGDLEWEPSPVQRNAAWAIYVELVTRVSTQTVELDHGMLREALASLHALFGITREVLRGAGPDVGAAQDTVGGVAIAVLNRGVRPFLAKWHPRLLAHETARPAGRPEQDWERQWEDEPKLRGELQTLREQLHQYVEALARMAGISA